ncbi:hypothetical protein CCACVL1_02191 [Corchorus capsularis]|uniref:Uncharacterized protein n=1 Tax=Corchorus capsularis TaxID=210143 RepID=A0A1R3KAN7_COCAP|nr:hypothetical protein CCACVL1_02191 [Corchorus capsularis]
MPGVLLCLCIPHHATYLFNKATRPTNNNKPHMGKIRKSNSPKGY